MGQLAKLAMFFFLFLMGTAQAQILTDRPVVLPQFKHAYLNSEQGESYLLAQNDYHALNGKLLAQIDADDTYDPFADYSEFEESAEEEEDINFFRNGRLFTLGLTAGYRGFTQVLGQVYGSGATFGVFLSYFFDLRFALQIGFITGDYPFTAQGPTEAIRGNVGLSDVSFNLKYYFNTQNVTRGLADLNPYLIGGFSQVFRTVTVRGNDNFSKDSAFAVNLGTGLEIPMLRNKMYFGVQGMYQLVNFADENQVIRQSDNQATNITPKGDSYIFLGILGINF